MIKYRELVGEKEIEHYWWQILKTFFPNSTIEARDTGKNTDGVLVDEEHNIRSLIEVKEDLDFTKGSEQAKVLIQSIFYIKQHEIKGDKLPKTIFIADKNEVFIVHTNAISKYLDYDIDWKSAASQAYKKYPVMLIDITEDENINPFVFDITQKNFNFDSIKLKLIDLSQNIKRLIKITDENIQQVFEYFIKNVLNKNNKMDVNEQVNLFIDLLINPDENYLHPKKKNTINTKSQGFVKVNEKNFINFFEHFDGNQYTVKEKENLVSIIDRLIEDETRKRNGEFFTPKCWTDEAVSMIVEEFGEDWKERFIIWDCSAGTGNLTRDYKFKELYQSTLQRSDISTMEQMGINPEGVKFQFDFLNDDLELLKEPDYAPGLHDAIQSGKEILFFINPPYGRASSGINGKDASRTGIAETKIGEEMKDKKLGQSSSQLYTQFLYRILKIQEINKNIKISIFAKSLYMSGGSFKNFRKTFLNEFNYKDGMLFQASHFADVKGSWGIDFSIWENGNCVDKTNFIHKIKDIEEIEIKTLENKNIYNLDNLLACNKWIRFETKKETPIDAPQLSSSLNVVNSGKGSLIDNSIGYYYNDSNSIMKNSQSVGLFSSCFSHAQGLSTLKNNYKKVISLFSTRKLISGKYANWINDKDEYIAPSEQVQQTIEYKQYNNDAIVYSLFNTSSNQSSMRNVEYKDKLWNIKNEFFWLAKEEMMELADKYYCDDLYKDARSSDDRFVYKLLNGKLSEKEFEEVGLTYVDENNKPILSPDAQELLDLSRELIIKSFKFRKLMHEEYPEYHLNTFDSGWYQCKKIFNAYMKDEYKVFVEMYKRFEERLRPQVYDFGLLLK